MEDAACIVESMGLDEKLALLSGRDFWHMNGVPSAGLDAVMLTDGPHGLRKQVGKGDHLGLNESVPATCFPPACLMASSWDEDAVGAVGEAIGVECCQEDVAMLLGPGVNIKRSPLCGRNFEYYSEDPLLAGRLAAAFIKGVQGKGVATSLKHFAANNQETLRLSSSSLVDERTLREVYLRAFEIAVKEARPASLMCSYNMINGTYSSDNAWLLTKVLRDEWGFEGFVVTDWGAMSDIVKAIKAGCDLEMPGPSPDNAGLIRKALEEGRLSEADIDKCVTRLVHFLIKSSHTKKAPYDEDGHHQMARRMASSSFVLLENDGTLPLKADGRYSLIGSLAHEPRYQGAGSSKINPTKLDRIDEALTARGVQYSYAPGYDVHSSGTDEDLIREAKAVASASDVVILVLGLPSGYESEGFDRSRLDLPEGQLRLLDALKEVGRPLVVLIEAGGPVLLPFRKEVSSLLFCYLGGQALGTALADVIFGDLSPSGHLAESFPLSIEDTPAYGSFATGERNVEYREALLVGYKWYDHMGLDVAYPFGHGLSYTSFHLDAVRLSKAEGPVVYASCDITNTGDCDGDALIQVYVGKADSQVFRPVRSLAGFRKLHLLKGQKRTVLVKLDPRAFQYWDFKTASYEVEEGEYQVSVGFSSRDLVEEKSLYLNGTVCKPSAAPAVPRGRKPVFEDLFQGPLPLPTPKEGLTLNSTVDEILATEAGAEVLGPIVKASEEAMASLDPEEAAMMKAALHDQPLRGLAMGGVFSAISVLDQIHQLEAK